MIEINWTAVRAFNRVWFPVAVQLDECARCDAQYDAGEWSNIASAQIGELTFNAYLAKIAPRFDMTPAQLEIMLMHADFEGDDRMHKALMEKSHG